MGGEREEGRKDAVCLRLRRINKTVLSKSILGRENIKTEGKKEKKKSYLQNKYQNPPQNPSKLNFSILRES